MSQVGFGQQDIHRTCLGMLYNACKGIIVHSMTDIANVSITTIITNHTIITAMRFDHEHDYHHYHHSAL